MLSDSTQSVVVLLDILVTVHWHWPVTRGRGSVVDTRYNMHQIKVLKRSDRQHYW